MGERIQVRLRWAEKRKLERVLKKGGTIKERVRAQMVLLSGDGKTAGEIARIMRVSHDTVAYAIRRYKAEGNAGLADKPRVGRPRKLTAEMDGYLEDCVNKDPHEYGVARAAWTTGGLAAQLKRKFKVSVTDDCVRLHLIEHGLVCRRPTWTVKPLALTQPDYKKKRRAVKRLLRRPPRSCDVYVQDEAQMSLFPTLTRMWMPRGKQRRILAPGVSPPKRYESVAIDWRNGCLLKIRGPKRNADIFCAVVEQCVGRSRHRKRRAIILCDGARFHKAHQSLKVRRMLQIHGDHLQLIYIPAYDPESNPTEMLWPDWRNHVTHNHCQKTIAKLARCSDRYFHARRRNPQHVLRTIGSPFAKASA